MQGALLHARVQPMRLDLRAMTHIVYNQVSRYCTVSLLEQAKTMPCCPVPGAPEAAALEQSREPGSSAGCSPDVSTAHEAPSMAHMPASKRQAREGQVTDHRPPVACSSLEQVQTEQTVSASQAGSGAADQWGLPGARLEQSCLAAASRMLDDAAPSGLADQGPDPRQMSEMAVASSPATWQSSSVPQAAHRPESTDLLQQASAWGPLCVHQTQDMHAPASLPQAGSRSTPHTAASSLPARMGSWQMELEHLDQQRSLEKAAGSSAPWAAESSVCWKAPVPMSLPEQEAGDEAHCGADIDDDPLPSTFVPLLHELLSWQ